MGYQRSDRYGSDDRWRDREQRGRYSERGGFGRGHERDFDRHADHDHERERHDRDDRSFFERAGAEVRSWFGDDDDDDRRERYGYRGGSAEHGRPSGDRGWFTESRGGERGYRYGADGRSRSYSSPVSSGQRPGGDIHDPHYSEWRSRQIDELDRDYEEYRREHQSRFEQEFGTWRGKRQGQRQMLGKVTEHMDVVGQDGQHVGKVDKVRGDRIILAKNDPAAGGHHHSIPCGWVDAVEDKVKLGKTADEVMKAWRDEDANRALFERENRGSDGPHVLDRSFSGTYGNRDD